MRWGAISCPGCTRTTLMRLSTSTCSCFFGASGLDDDGTQLHEAFDFQGGNRIDGVGNSCTGSHRWAWLYLLLAGVCPVASVCAITYSPATPTAEYAHTGGGPRDRREPERDGWH